MFAQFIRSLFVNVPSNPRISAMEWLRYTALVSIVSAAKQQSNQARRLS